MKKGFLKYFSLGIVLTTIVFSACRKDDYVGDDPQATNTAGNTFVKVLENNPTNIYFTPFTDIKKVHLISVRRDAANADALSKPQTIVLTTDAAAITDYNTKNQSDYEALPESIYTLAADPGVTKTATGYTVTFAAGEFAKEIDILLDGSKYDLAKKYAFSVKISDPAGNQISSGHGSGFVLISIKNKYDGIYAVTGTLTDVTNAAWSHYTSSGEKLYYALQTLSATKCVVIDESYTGIPATPFWTGTGKSYFGTFGLIVEFDPATDKIISVTNYYGTPANTRAAALDPSGINSYASGLINIKYYMLQPNTVTTAPYIRTQYNESWTYFEER